MPKKKKEEESTPEEVDVLAIIDELENKKGAKLKPVSLISSSGIKHTLSTGCLTANLILGGGYPPGRVVEVFGPAGSGKSTLMYHCCAALHALKVPTMFFDHEASSEPDYMRRVGMKLDDKSGLTRYYQPESGDQTYRRILKILKKLPDRADGPPQCAFIIDSIAAMPAQSEIDEPEKNPLGLRARLHSEWMGKIKTLLGRKRATLVVVNQTRMKIGVMFGNPEDKSGGQAWKFYPDVSMRVSRVDKLVEVGAEKFAKMRMSTQKNKHFRPFQKAEVYIHLGRGIAREHDMTTFLRLTGFLNSKGNPTLVGLDEYAPKGKKVDQRFKSNAAFEEFMQEDDLLYKCCQNVLKSGDAQLRYLAVQSGYGIEELAAGEHLTDVNIMYGNEKKLKAAKKKKKAAKKKASSKKKTSTKKKAPAKKKAAAKKKKK